MMAPAQKRRPPNNMESFLPYLRVTMDATSDANKAAKYREEVNMVSV
jgi:hypothetical protein